MHSLLLILHVTYMLQVFLVDGAGSRGDATPGNASYGSTKAAMVQLKKSLAAEVKGTGVGVHLFSPGALCPLSNAGSS